MRLEKQIISELNRMREIMGLSLLVEITLPAWAKRYFMEILGYTEKQIDVLEKSADDFSDLSRLSDEFANLGIRNFEDLQRHVAEQMGLRSVDDVADEVILKWMKESPEFVQGVTLKLNQLIADASESLIKKLEWEDLVGVDIAREADYLLKYATDANSAPYIREVTERYQREVGEVIQDLESKGETVPESLRNLYDDLGEKATQAKNMETKFSQDFSNVPGNIGGRVDDVVDDVVADAADEVIELSPNDLLKEVLENNKKAFKRQYPDVPDDAIDNIMDELTTAYGRFDFNTLVTKLDELTESFNSKMKALQDEADEYIKQGDIDKANKAKARIEKLKEVLKFLGDNKITRACIGSSSKVKPGTMGRETISTVDLNWSTLLRTPGCLAGASVLLSYLYNWNKDPMDKEFIACAAANGLAICPSLPTNWCTGTCGQRTENYVGVNECFGSVPGWSEIPFKAKNNLIALGLDCSFRQKDVAPEKFITNIKYYPAAAGGVEYWIITMNGKNYTVNTTKGLPTGTPPSNPTPPTATYTNDLPGFQSWALANGKTDAQKDSSGYWYKTPGNTNWQTARYKGTSPNGTFE